MSSKTVAVTCLSVAVMTTTAFFAGGVTARNQIRAEPLKTEQVKVIHTETETIKEVKVPTQPESCARAVELSDQILKAFSKYDNAASRLMAMSEPLGSAIATKSLTKLNEARKQMYDFNSDVATVIADYTSAQSQLQEAMTDCIKDTNK